MVMKMDYIFLLVLVGVFNLSLRSQTECLIAGVTFTAQAQLDSFLITYPECTFIAGNVDITGADITSLAALHNITSIGGNLAIYGNPLLPDLTGLGSLDSIGGILYVRANHQLVDMSGLNSIHFIGGDLIITENNSMTNLHGIGSLEFINGNVELVYSNLVQLDDLDPNSVGGSIKIESNPFLTSLNGMPSLQSIGRDILIVENAELMEINGFNKLDKIRGELAIGVNPKLMHLAGFIELDSVGRLNISTNGFEEITGFAAMEYIFSLAVQGCPNLLHLPTLFHVDSINGVQFSGNTSLLDFTGIDSVRTIRSDLFITGNYSITSFHGLEGLENFTGYLYIADNPLLSDISALDHTNGVASQLGVQINPLLGDCNIPLICNHIPFSGPDDIYGNAPGCSSVEEVVSSCISNIHNLSNDPVKIFPNPTNGNLKISGLIVNEFEYFIQTYQGQFVEKGISFKQELNVSQLPPGIYFISIKWNNATINKKFLKT
jgi:hypothetical protein